MSFAHQIQEELGWYRGPEGYFDKAPLAVKLRWWVLRPVVDQVMGVGVTVYGQLHEEKEAR